jgi:ABC-2 type transport system ATP-binding protein
MTAIEVRNLSKKFKDKEEFFALRDVNLRIEEGEIFSLLGPNGSGKTTLINIILTILIPDEGSVKIFGKDPFKEKEVLQQVNYVPIEKPTSHLKVKDFLHCYSRLYGVKNNKRVEEVLKELNIFHLKESECWMLSTGELSKLALAKALLNNPKILILDEPTFGLDPKTKKEIHSYMKKLNKKGTTIFFASHDMVEVERLAERIGFIKNGRILNVETKKNILRKFNSIEEYWLRLGK